MANFYDKYGGAYSSVSANDILNSTGSSSGGVFSSVPISSSDTSQIRETPNFKAMFEDYQLHNPDLHRGYLLTADMIHSESYNITPIGSRPLYERLTWDDDFQPFDKTKLELQTIKKDDKEYVTLSTDFIDYLKSMDERAVKSVVGYQFLRDSSQSEYNALPTYKKSGSYAQALLQEVSYYNSKISDVNTRFGEFVGRDFTASVVALNKPFYYESQNEDNLSSFIPISLGNFSAYEIDEVINDIFGNVTDDDFIPSVNEERYNQKAETECCLQLCSAPELYRMKGVPYEESEQKVVDDIEFQKYLDSDEFTPYVPPPPYKKITLGSYASYYQKQVTEFLNSPLMYLFEKVKPYLVEGLISLTNGGYIDGFKIENNDIYIQNDLRNLF